MDQEEPRVQLGHGGGGIMQEELIQFITKNIVLKSIGGGIGVSEMDDGATIPFDDWDNEIVVSADGHTVFPLHFPGGDLGKLSVCGTVNDLIMMGAKPLALTSIVLIEEGLPFSLLGEIMDSFNKTAEKAQIAILAGDSKVMPAGTLKEMVISTTGIGIKPKDRIIHDGNCKPGDKVILTGSIGDHGAALIAKREGIELQTTLESDVGLLTPLLSLIETFPEIHAMKDPTRGGLATALNEWTTKSNVDIRILEDTILIKPEVKSICDLLGFDPLEVANEGKAVIAVDPLKADALLSALHQLEIGKDARIIGEVIASDAPMVIMETPLGGHRIVEKPMGELIPRIC